MSTLLHRGRVKGKKSFVCGYYVQKSKFEHYIAQIEEVRDEMGVLKKKITYREVDSNPISVFTEYHINKKKLFTNDYVLEYDSYGRKTIRICLMIDGQFVLKLVEGKSGLPKYISLHDSYKFMKDIVGNVYVGY